MMASLWPMIIADRRTGKKARARAQPESTRNVRRVTRSHGLASKMKDTTGQPLATH